MRERERESVRVCVPTHTRGSVHVCGRKAVGDRIPRRSNNPSFISF